MGNSNSQPEPQPLMDAPRYPLPDFNDIFHKGVPKMMQVADDMHRMTDYIMDLRNMTLGLVGLSIIGMFFFLILKWHHSRKASRRRRYRTFQNGDYGSEHSSLSRPYRTYPQKQADWTLHHHKIDMDKMMESQPSQTNTGSTGRTTPPTTTSSMPNGGPMIKAPFSHNKFGPPVKLMVEDCPYADEP